MQVSLSRRDLVAYRFEYDFEYQILNLKIKIIKIQNTYFLYLNRLEPPRRYYRTKSIRFVLVIFSVNN